jgi:hypothetical protein
MIKTVDLSVARSLSVANAKSSMRAAYTQTWVFAGIFGRLGCSAQKWHNRMQRLNGGRLLGRLFPAARAKLLEIGERLGVRHLVTLAGYPAR